MGRPPKKPVVAPRTPVRSLPPAADVMQALMRAWAPVLQLLLASGADYPRLSAALKPLFIEQAQLELLRSGQKETDSALTLLSGVHRKDVRAWRLNGLGEPRSGARQGRTARDQEFGLLASGKLGAQYFGNTKA